MPEVRSLVAFLEHEPDPMIVLDRDYTILAANAAYRRHFGGPAGARVVGRKCHQVSHGYAVPCDRAGEHCPMQQALRTRQPDRVLHIHHSPRGPEHVDVELRPIEEPGKGVVAFVERLNTVHGASVRPAARGLVGGAPAFNRALAALQRVAPSNLPVLFLGESGTGKELFAQALHEASRRADGPFVVVDCTGFSEALFESELFGHEKGAFTGAHARKPGLVETAHGGTLFLDEIGDVPLPIQAKLLRLIESGTFRRVGSVQTQHADFRLVAATHMPLEQMVGQGRFRADLFYRIAAFPLRLPALRERREDIPLLVESLVRREGATKQQRFAPGALRALAARPWPGNIRQLRNVVERARLLADGATITEAHLDDDGVSATRHEPSEKPPEARSAPPRGRLQSLVEAEILRQAEAHGGSRRDLAAHLGISERSLYRRLAALARKGQHTN